MRANLLLSFALFYSLAFPIKGLSQDQSWQAPGQSSSGNWQAPANNQSNWPNPSGNQAAPPGDQNQWQGGGQPQANQWSQPQSNYAGTSQAQIPAENGQYQEPGSYLNNQRANGSYDQLSANGQVGAQNNSQQGFQPDNTLQSQVPSQQGKVKKSHDGLKHALVEVGKAAAVGAGAAAPLAGAMMMSRAMYPYGGMGMPYGGGYGYGMGMPYGGGYGYGMGMPYGGMMNPGMSNFLHF